MAPCLILILHICYFVNEFFGMLHRWNMVGEFIDQLSQSIYVCHITSVRQELVSLELNYILVMSGEESPI